ncbi:HNH endonuclease [Christiangramia sp. ASW11-125]|uniref:HNH endonuclease n=1 Tax=Christiangramia sp. ASW11-125 TaxID=3400701 RepID=UPI003AAB25B8
MINPNSNRTIFNISKEVYEQKISKSEGVNQLVEELNFNRGSAQMIIGQIFPRLLDGEKFTRTLNIDLFDSFLKFIQEDYGNERLIKSLNALKMHIDYIKQKGDSKIGLRKVYQRYIDNLNLDEDFSREDEEEQEEISDYLKKNKTKKDLLNELDKAENDDSEKVTVNHRQYKRNNKIIALIKILRNFECQICGYYVKKRNGGKYIEAAHIRPKHKQGPEKPENILLLCPNHHKEFDFGELTIKNHTNENIEFHLNGELYNLSLKLE